MEQVYVVWLGSRNDYEAVFEGDVYGYQEAVKFANLLRKDTVDMVLVYKCDIGVIGK